MKNTNFEKKGKMISKLTVENYKGFEKLIINDISNINLFGGDNNIGKTSLLESIFLYYDRMASDTMIKQFGWRGLTSLAVNNQRVDEIWAPYFFNYDTSRIIKLWVVENRNIDDTLEITLVKDYKNPNESKKIDQIVRGLSGSSVNTSDTALHLINKNASGKIFESNVYLSDQGLKGEILTSKIKQKIAPAFFYSNKLSNTRQDAVLYGQLLKDGNEDVLLKYLQDFEPRLKSISPVPISEMETLLHGDIGLRKKIPLNLLGDGISKLSSIIMNSFNVKNGVMLIDEIENGFHYTKHKLVWDIIFKLSVDLNIQVFANTHSWEMVTAFQEVGKLAMKNFSFYELFRSPKNERVGVNFIDMDTLGYKLEAGKSFRGE